CRERLLRRVEREHTLAVDVERAAPRAVAVDQVAFDQGVADRAARIRRQVEADRGFAVRVHDVVLEDVLRNAVASFVEDEAPGRAAVRVDRVVIDVIAARRLRAGAALRRDAFAAVVVDEVTPNDVAEAFGLLSRIRILVGRRGGVAYDVALEEVVRAHQRQIAAAFLRAEDLAPVVLECVQADHVIAALDLQQVMRAAQYGVALQQVVLGIVDLDRVAPILAGAVVVDVDDVDDVVQDFVVMGAVVELDAVPPVGEAERAVADRIEASAVD